MDINRLKELSGLDEENSDPYQSARFAEALTAPDAKIEIKKGKQFDPLSDAEYQIEVYAPSVNESIVFIAEISKFRGYYMSD